MRSPWKKLALFGLSLMSLVAPSSATWSIVFVDHRTGEVGIASATCLSDIDLANGLPILLVGQGVVAAQSSGVLIDTAKDIRKGIKAGMTPKALISKLKDQPGANGRQFGIATFTGPPVTWTGNQTKASGKAWDGHAGTLGSVDYAIQGNVLAGVEVIDNAEIAFLTTPGDLSQKMLAVMQEARRWGGDGRCSCSNGDPDGCGSPPPGFGPDDKSAHVGFMILSRLGDDSGKCTAANGCADGDYYLNVEFNGSVASNDPVAVMTNKYNAWRAALAGRPDAILSEVEVETSVLMLGDEDASQVRVRLVDVDGQPLSSGGDAVTVVTTTGRPPISDVSPVVDNGDGTYAFTLAAGTQAGTEELEIWVDDGIRPVRLHPSLRIRIVEAAGMIAGTESVRVGRRHPVTLAFAGRPERAGAPYLMVGRLAGAGASFTALTADHAGGPYLPGTLGVLDDDGRARARFAPPVDFWARHVGERLEWTTLLVDPVSGRLETSNRTGFEIEPW